MSGWSPLTGTTARVGCPHCDWHMDEPPMESSTESTGDGWVYRIRQQSALPAAAAHVLAKHPESPTAEAIRVHVVEHGSVEAAVRADLSRALAAVTVRFGT